MTRKTAIWIVGTVVMVGLVLAELPAAETGSVETTSAEKANVEKFIAAQPQVEVAFVLDTTGSMGGLIEGAKKKIWSVANQILLGEPKPKVRMALVGYRDKGDDYVTKVFDLTDNIDKVYENLSAFRAGGGGDGPENVNQAMQDAITKLNWSKDRKTLKIIYLVGDSPPHNEYQDVPTYDKLAKQAIEKGIIVNTILCGNNNDTQKIWQAIAKMAEGNYFAIAQDGGMRDVETPYDKDLAELNRDLMDTVVVYGSRERQTAARARNESVSKKMSQPAMSAIAADRAGFASKSGKVGSGDLIEAVQNKTVDLKKVDKTHLPAEMQTMSPKQQEEYIQKQQAKREVINEKIKNLSEKRAAYVRKELESKAGAKDSFDAKVLESLRTQAAKKDITYK